MSLFSLLDHTATRFPDHGAVFQGLEQVLSWRELKARALRLGAAIHARCGAGERVAVVSENRPEYVELMFSAWAAGAVIVPVNYKLHDKEVLQILEDSEASLVFVSPKLLSGLPRTAATYADRLVLIGDPIYDQMTSGEPIEVPFAEPQSLAWLFYTSGTTGRSKGAMLSHRNLMAATIAHLADIEALDEWCSQLHVAPMSHGSGMYMLPSIARGARQVVPVSGAFEPAEFLDLCDVHPACGAFLAPTMIQRLRLAVEEGKRSRPKHLRNIVYGGGPMYVEELRKSMTVLGPVFSQIYGQGEAPVTITGMNQAAHATDDDAILGSVGWPRSGVEVRVTDSEGKDLPTGTVGEILCRGDVVMAGYWRNPEASAETLRGGWLHTGDMGTFDERGCLTLRDRSKDVVISGGSNIYPREVEEVLLLHPAVAKTSVVGRPDAEWGEVLIAFVVKQEGVDVSPAELDMHCLEHIARFKRPKEYRFLDELPTSSYGKVLKNELRKLLVNN